MFCKYGDIFGTGSLQTKGSFGLLPPVSNLTKANADDLSKSRLVKFDVT